MDNTTYNLWFISPIYGINQHLNNWYHLFIIVYPHYSDLAEPLLALRGWCPGFASAPRWAGPKGWGPGKNDVQSSTGCLWEKDQRHLHRCKYGIYIYIYAVCCLYTKDIYIYVILLNKERLCIVYIVYILFKKKAPTYPTSTWNSTCSPAGNDNKDWYCWYKPQKIKLSGSWQYHHQLDYVWKTWA